ncbi:LrgB family protein [Paenibacillus filicis]|uniref:LrgB family protein n=1 Tax=Paenibacillus filicis TaxID=669464 RepID=A0ABU9DM80_9BACL
MLYAACFIVTILIYGAVKRLYRLRPVTLLSPLLLAPAFIVAVLLESGIPYGTYEAGTSWISSMIGPATVAMAVPLYKNVHILKKHALAIGVSVLTGALVSITTSVWLARSLQLSDQIVGSLAPRSATTPIALAVSGMNGGLPALTALFVLLTGLLGILIGPLVIRIFRIRNAIARGVLLGTSAHTAGTTKAFEYDALTGSISSISMILTAFVILCSTPWLLHWLAG